MFTANSMNCLGEVIACVARQWNHSAERWADKAARRKN